MASISAGSFHDVQLRGQISDQTLVDMSDRSANHQRRVFALNVVGNFELYGSKFFLDSEGVELGDHPGVVLPRKMTMALYHAAVRKGYLR